MNATPQIFLWEYLTQIITEQELGEWPPNPLQFDRHIPESAEVRSRLSSICPPLPETQCAQKMAPSQRDHDPVTAPSPGGDTTPRPVLSTWQQEDFTVLQP